MVTSYPPSLNFFGYIFFPSAYILHHNSQPLKESKLNTTKPKRRGGMVVDSGNRCDDRLSNLPEALLTSILSMVPTKQAATTAVLSKRWRYLWHSVTNLQLLHENLTPTSDDRSAVGAWELMINSIELSVPGPIYSCRISFVSSDSYILRMNAFLLSLVEKGIRELSVIRRGVGCYELPAQIFFCPTLEKLELDKCMISILPLSSLQLTINCCSNIKSLILSGVYFTDDHFQKVISSCRLLENLKVDCCERVRHLKIRAPRLLSLEIITSKRIRVLLIDVASLRRATFKFQFKFINLIHEEDGSEADNLVQLLMGLAHCHLERLSLQLGLVFGECLQLQGAEFPLSLPPQYQFQAVKELDLEMSLSNLQVATVLSYLINSCPSLHELKIQDIYHQDTTGSYWVSQNPSQCLINHLRIVQVCRVNLQRSGWIGFVRYLLMNAPVCERVTIRYSGDPSGKKLVDQKLKMIQWASPHAVLELKPLG